MSTKIKILTHLKRLIIDRLQKISILLLSERHLSWLSPNIALIAAQTTSILSCKGESKCLSSCVRQSAIFVLIIATPITWPSLFKRAACARYQLARLFSIATGQQMDTSLSMKSSTLGRTCSIDMTKSQSCTKISNRNPTRLRPLSWGFINYQPALARIGRLSARSTCSSTRS
jgi:hypothetical protein